MSLQRAWSILTIKSVDEEKRILTGIATTPSIDAYGDVVEPKGAEYTLPIPLLWQHMSSQPIGEVFACKVTQDGIEVQARLAKIEDAGTLKNRLDEAWQSLKAGLVRGLSIGFSSLEESYDKTTGGYRYIRWAWRELSCVTIPANMDCTIATIRSLDPGAPARRSSPPGVSGSSRTVQMRLDTPMKKTYADQIATWEATRAAKVARQEAIQQKALDEGRGKDDAEKEDFTTLGEEIASIDAELTDLRALETREKAAVVPAGRDRGVHVRPGAHITVEKKLPAGIQFARYAMCVGMSRGNPFEAKQLAAQNYPDDSAIQKLIELTTKAGVGAGATVTSHNLDDLVPYNIMDDFIEYLRPQTILGKFGTNGIPALRRVPFNTRVSGFSAGLSAAWVGEGLPALPSKATSMNISLTWAKLAALAILTKEEMRFSNPSAEAKIRDDIARSIITKQDKDFIDPAKSATAGVSPQSITFNTTPIAPTAATAAAFRTDFATLMNTFAVLFLSPADIVLIMSTTEALNLSLMVNSLGVQVFPNLTMAGGSLLGFPVITSEALTSLGSPVEDIIVAVKASEIYLSDDGVVTIDASDQASIEMQDSSSQSGLTGTGASLVSLWQTGMVGLLATREINWKLRRTGAARYLGPCLYRA